MISVNMSCRFLEEIHIIELLPERTTAPGPT